MSRGNAKDAYSAAIKAAREIVRGCIKGVLQGIRDGEVPTEDELSDRIHEECDNALIYTSDQWLCAYGLPENEDAIGEGLCSPSNFGEALAAQAFCNLRAAVEAHDFSEAFAVAEDAQLEVTP